MAILTSHTEDYNFCSDDEDLWPDGDNFLLDNYDELYDNHYHSDHHKIEDGHVDNQNRDSC